eukprot:TRINITY_DN5526_c0_g1_i1.p1 TRINITY_DN5526_c0_g1~~TRINITY_DN5526_c0_g1_i1.p1  ORF type:complete len:814 (+),score=322.55 TRINITY_DN5526_c0_g1_i1:403-2844(+)
MNHSSTRHQLLFPHLAFSLVSLAVSLVQFSKLTKGKQTLSLATGMVNQIKSASQTSGLMATGLASSQNVVQRHASSSAASYKFFEVENQDGVAVVRMDTPDGKMNMVSTPMMTEFDGLLDSLTNDAAVKAIVVISKQDNFIVGADINEFVNCKSSEEFSALTSGGQKIMKKMEDSKKPIVAAMKGNSLGGGFEFALACHYRVASKDKSTSMALPEVQLGILPASGGCQRLPKLMGAKDALPHLLTGKPLKAEKAAQVGVVNQLSTPENLESDAVAAARSLIESGTTPSGQKSLLNYVLEDTPFGRNFLFGQARATALRQSKGHYPAIPAIIDCVQAGVSGKDGYAKEVEHFGKLGMTSVSRNLVSIFFAQTALKKNRFGNPEKTYNNLAVVGAGLMGAGITDVSVNKGFNVLLKDSHDKGLNRGKEQVLANLNKRLARKSINEEERDLVMSRIDGITEDTPNGDDKFKNVDMVIEAVFEDLDLKKKLIARLEKVLPEHAVFATNTSAIPIADIAAGSQRPENVIGMHYFSPVEKMPLLEVIATDQTSNEAKAAAVDVGIKQGKTVIVVGDGPGFYTSRILAPMMMEGATLMLEGIDMVDLDKHLQAFGFPVGPVTLMDEVGIDVAQHITPGLQKAFGARMEGNGDLIEDMVQAGFLGRKAKAGFYSYAPPKPPVSGPLGPVLNPIAKKIIKPSRRKPVNQEAQLLVSKHYTPSQSLYSLTTPEIQNRMVSRFVNEAVFCLQDGILSNPTDGDIGAVFGLGFPPFLGGPFRYLDAYGADKYVVMMNKLADKYGERFAPAQMLVDMANSGKKFHQ